MTTAEIKARPAPIRKRPIVSNVVFGTSLFVFTEIMLFVALISSFIIIKRSTPEWAAPAAVTLPIVASAANTFILSLSGALMIWAGRLFAHEKTKSKAPTMFLYALVLGLMFVSFQGYEWVKLIRYGMTMTSGPFGATFYLLVGAHAIHVALAVIIMAVMYTWFRKGRMRSEHLTAMQVYWLFVVGLWPVLYGLVYF